MSEEMLAVVRDEIGKSIQTHVNGKLDKLHAMLEKQNERANEVHSRLDKHLEEERTFNGEIRAHMEEVKPFLQGAAGISVLWKGLIALAIGWTALRSGLHF